MDEDLLEVARVMRSYLPELVGSEAESYDRRIAGLLASARSGRDVEEELTAVLQQLDQVHAWAAQVLQDDHHRPPDQQPVFELGFEPLPGAAGPVPAVKYCCPEGDYVWWRRSVGQTAPSCPSHGSLDPCDA
jgi:hypothetical protein